MAERNQWTSGVDGGATLHTLSIMLGVLVIGAGPTGLSLALSLRRFGVACRIIDQAPEPVRTARAHELHARTLEILDDYGIAADVLARATTVAGVNIYGVGGRRVARLNMEEFDTPASRVHLIPQSEVEALLRQELSSFGVAVEWSSRLVALSQRTDRVLARLATGERVSARWLVGCDGAHSEVRRQLGIPFDGAAYAQTYCLADVRLGAHTLSPESHIWMDPRGVLLAIPLGEGGWWRLFADVTGMHTEGALPNLSRDFCQDLLAARCRPEVPQLCETGWFTAVRLHHRLARRYQQQRVFLAGDAAHIFSPFGGQGLNTGIQDAYNLGWKLGLVESGVLLPAALASYQQERRPIGARALRQAHQNTRMVTLRNPWVCYARDALIQAVLSVPVSHRILTAQASELQLTYRGTSSIGQGSGRWHRPTAGDRAPDTMVRLAGARSARLFELLRGTHHTLMIFSGRRRAAPRPALAAATLARACLGVQVRTLDIDADTPMGIRAHRVYGIGGSTVLLIRPDGHIAYRGSVRNLRDLRAYLARFYLPPTSRAAPVRYAV